MLHAQSPFYAKQIKRSTSTLIWLIDWANIWCVLFTEVSVAIHACKQYVVLQSIHMLLAVEKFIWDYTLVIWGPRDFKSLSLRVSVSLFKVKIHNTEEEHGQLCGKPCLMSIMFPSYLSNIVLFPSCTYVFFFFCSAHWLAVASHETFKCVFLCIIYVLKLYTCPLVFELLIYW